MCNSNLNTPNFLDKVRTDKGIDDLKDFFQQLSKKDLKKSINFINDENLQFATLFILREDIEKNNLIDSLLQRNKTALAIIKEILTDKKSNLASKQVSFDHVQIIHSTLKWILETGFRDDGMNDEYDQVLDITSILLTKVYMDKTVLPIIADMIFDRHKRGYLIHDLVWAFFQARDPQSLMIIGERLLSSNEEDVKTACRLLNFIPNIDKDKNNTREDKYSIFLGWIKENSPFLKFTGESFQQTTNPRPYRVVLEGKYLCKNICSDTGKASCSPSQEEYKMLNEFKKLDKDTKILLSNFSLKIHHNNIKLWNVWRHYSLEDQIKIARIGGIQ
ncbi:MULTISPECIES: hypothetical protein [Clostridium]|jgi:hypothetical protein|uniref:hypothetical protein n=1 Tax=Clostridium TaxID=1485 RepID=UPI000287E0C1|nr:MULTISPECIES: hypothetical protein [Clostridium]MDF2503854.1 hypothetical protein [Clostridium sp.]